MTSCKNKLGNTDKLLYEIGLVALGIAMAAVLLYCITDFSVLSIHYICVFNKVTHLPCPGCGGTRAMRALVSGDILSSLYYYPPLLYAIIVYIVFMVRCFLYKHFSIAKSKDGTVVYYIYGFVALMFIQWITKLVLQIKFGYTF